MSAVARLTIGATVIPKQLQERVRDIIRQDKDSDICPRCLATLGRLIVKRKKVADVCTGCDYVKEA